MTLSPGTHLGPYEILGPIGEGGMGVVYRALDPRLSRQVAIKLLPQDLAADPDAQERLRFEAIAAAALDHPYICKIYEVAEHEGAVCLVMEYIAGETLRQRLARGRVIFAEMLRIAAEITDALEAAHAGGILHRDLKPANIMLTQQGHVKIMDFGLAKRMTAFSDTDASITRLTMPGAILGTPAYMSPEQVKGLPLDARSDLFSFGVILAEISSGVSPFQRPSMAETMTAVLHDPPHINRDLPPATIAVLERLLAKTPEDRYGSAGELRQQLSELSATPSVPAAISDAQWTPVRVPPVSLPAQPVNNELAAAVPLLVEPLSALSRRAQKRLEKALNREEKPRKKVPWVLLPLLFIFWPNVQRFVKTEFGELLPASLKTPTASGPIRSIAVLPLDNNSGDPTQNDLAQNMTDALTADLATIAQLRVVPPASVKQYKGDDRPSTADIAEELKVDSLLEGTVSRFGDTVRITAQLIDARTDKLLWSRSFERKSSDAPALDDDLVSAIATEIKLPLTPAEKTRLHIRP
jgi:serine/threonine-protein kinase